MQHRLVLTWILAASGLAYADPVQLDRTVQNVPPQGGAFSVHISTEPPGLNYRILSAADWISNYSTAGTGDTNLSYFVFRNTTGSARTAVLTIGTATLTIQQASFDRAFLSQHALSLGPGASNGSIDFSTTSTTYAWTATSSDAWLTITSAHAGTGSGQVTFSATPNHGVSRSATISVGDTNVYDGALITQSADGTLRFVPATPCRVVDTRGGPGLSGIFATPALLAGETRSFPLPLGSCNLPANAAAYSLNVTVVPRDPSLGYLTMFPTGQNRPLASTLNSSDGRVKAVGTLAGAGTGGAVSVYATDATDVILDLNGYFLPVGSATDALVFYPLSSCRAVDTRSGSGSALQAGQIRTYNLASGNCAAPPTAKAFVLNATVVPTGFLGYLTLWPNGSTQPFVSTLNSPKGETVANLAVVPAGPDGSVNVYATDKTDLVVDLAGYFAPPNANSTGGLSFYSQTPCRAVDTRNAAGAFGGPALVPGQVRSFFLTNNGSPCTLPTGSSVFVNATVVPDASLGFLTLWSYTYLCGDGPVCQPQQLPSNSTLNAPTGGIVSNGAIVSSSFNAYATSVTHLVIDVNGFFAP